MNPRTRMNTGLQAVDLLGGAFIPEQQSHGDGIRRLRMIAYDVATYDEQEQADFESDVSAFSKSLSLKSRRRLTPDNAAKVIEAIRSIK